MRAGGALTVPEGTPPLWDGRTPATVAEWVALGREVFFGYPLRAESSFRWALEHPDVAERAGLRTAAGGIVPGMRLYVDPDGKRRLASRAPCAAASAEGRAAAASAASFDYGAPGSRTAMGRARR